MCALFLGVRADSTHTEAVLADGSGRPFGHVQIPNREARSSRELLERAFQEASIEYSGPIPPLVAVMGLPGLHSDPLRRAAAETVRQVLPVGSRALICDQLEPLLAGALEGEAGHLVSSGHDAAIGSVDRQGRFIRTDEPAEMMGQEGSGLWLGTRTLQLAARLLDGRLPESARLIAALTEHFQKRSLQDVWDAVMAEAPDAVKVIDLATRTIALAEPPDPEPACRALVVRVARRLCELLATAMDDGGSPTLASWHGRTATGALLDELLRQTPEMRWQAPLFSGLDGCLFMARAYQPVDLGEGECQAQDVGPNLWMAMRERKDALVSLSLETGR